MSNLRQAAQQALEALEIGYDSAKAEADQFHSAMAGYKPQRHAQMDADVQTIAKAITALRAALAEPEQEPKRKGADASYAPAPALQGSPLGEQREGHDRVPLAASIVAWRTFDGEGGWDYRTYENNENYRDEYIKRNGERYASWVEPLYTSAPTPRKPLTEGGMPTLFVGGLALNSKATTEIVRAVEKAHGIGEQT